jgi:hypothetical protein
MTIPLVDPALELELEVVEELLLPPLLLLLVELLVVELLLEPLLVEEVLELASSPGGATVPLPPLLQAAAMTSAVNVAPCAIKTLRDPRRRLICFLPIRYRRPQRAPRRVTPPEQVHRFARSGKPFSPGGDHGDADEMRSPCSALFDGSDR